MQVARIEVETLASRIAECMRRDQHRLRSRLRAFRHGTENPSQAGAVAERLSRLSAEIERSAAERAKRLEQLPKPTYPEELPVVQRREEIAKLIAAHQVVVLCGETGSGKTTQLPKICLELGRGVSGMIGHTQPRRIAARSVATRIAEELQTPLGGAVGYKVRFNDHTRRETYIKLMTDGILLAETQGDRFLDAYDTIIIDEAHERSLNIDFLLGYLKQLLPQRPDLKLIITSATIDPKRFSKHFAALATRPSPPPVTGDATRLSSTSLSSVEASKSGVAPTTGAAGDATRLSSSKSGVAPTANSAGVAPTANDAPVIEVSGRTYPVEVRYRPLHGEDEDEEDVEMLQGILAAADELSRQGPGDILVFLSGEREIRETAEALRKHHPPGTEILPLYARLSAAEQMRVFQKHGKPRIVLATNVAETSLTVPGIRYVIDPGYARLSRYSPRTKVQRLPIERISQANADQRKGRCGRVGPGVCVRLYSEEDFTARAQFTDPEILRTNLASVILQMKAFRLGAVQDFPFVEPPDYRAVRDGYATLHELGAIDERNELTNLGHALARLPVDPRIGRMVLAARDENCMEEVLVIAAALSVQDPRERPMDKQEAADEAHKQFRDENSDFLSFLKLWEFFHGQAEHLSTSKMRKLCQTNFLSFVRMREWHDVHAQLKEVVGELGLLHEVRTSGRGATSGGAPVQRPRQYGKRTSGGDDRRRSDSSPESN